MSTSIESAERIGIMAAMQPELDAVIADFGRTAIFERCGRTFYQGEMNGRDVVAVVAGIGKTAATLTTTLLFDRLDCQGVILTGSAGRVSERLGYGDIVVATGLTHHDLDSSPTHPRYVVPSLGVAEIPTDADWAVHVFAAAACFVSEERYDSPRVTEGLVLSGDTFMNTDGISDLRSRFPGGLAVDMESAAVAQTCVECDIPIAVVRFISDGGDPTDFWRFLAEDCGPYAHGVISRTLEPSK